MTQLTLTDNLRQDLEKNAKTFKTSWIFLGQALYGVFRDKTFHQWGFDKFEDYTSQELGMKKQLAMKLVKTYFFVEQQEPNYLMAEFSNDKEAAIIPSYEPLDILRKAHRSDIAKEDYQKIRADVFKGKDASSIKKELTAMIKERKQIDPDAEREKNNIASIKKAINALKTFVADMETWQLVERKVIDNSEALLNDLEEII